MTLQWDVGHSGTLWGVAGQDVQAGPSQHGLGDAGWGWGLS